MQAMTATLVRHLNEQRRNFSIIITGILSHVCCPLEERGVRFLSLSFSVERRPVFITCNGLVLSTLPKSHETENLMTNFGFKLNQRAKIHK